MRWRPSRGLRRSGSRCEAWQDGRHLRAAQYERVSQSRELLYSVPAALCEEIARAATEELAEPFGLPLIRGAWNNPFFHVFTGFFCGATKLQK